MTEYEIADLILSNSAMMYMDGAAFMTLLSAYIVVVHLVGRSLTKFQLIFINFTFVGLATSSALGWLVLSDRSSALLQELAQQNPSSALVDIDGGEGLIVYFVFRSLVILGALIYMWQLRRSNVSVQDT
ncbi:MAG: hypothetical protein V7744_11865 [Pseudomonadales bacterium]